MNSPLQAIVACFTLNINTQRLSEDAISPMMCRSFDFINLISNSQLSNEKNPGWLGYV